MNFIQEVFTGESKAIHKQNIHKTTDHSSAVRSCSKEWKDPVGFRDEMKNKRYQARSNHRDGALSTFFIPQEKPPFIKKEFPTLKKGISTGYLSSSFIYTLTALFSRKDVSINRRKSHHDPISFNYR